MEENNTQQRPPLMPEQQNPTVPQGQIPITQNINPAEKPGYFIDPTIEKKFERMEFIERNGVWVRRLTWIGGGVFFFVAIFFIGSYLIRHLLPEPDSDGDGVPDAVDACPGHDDKIDKDEDKIPDDCDDAVPPITFNDISFSEPVLLEVSERKYDVIVNVTDANQEWGLNDFRFKVTLKDKDGNVQKIQNSESYILPKSTMTLIVSGITTSAPATVATIEIVSGNFTRSATSETIPTDIRDVVFNQTSSSGVAVLKGIIENESNYNLQQVQIRVLVKNKEGNVVSANFTAMNTLKVGELRAFELRWDRSFAGEVTYDIVATTNTLDPQNLIRKQGGPVTF